MENAPHRRGCFHGDGGARFFRYREWLAGAFTVADILMADVLRLVDRFGGLAAHPACKDYVRRATERPAFQKAHADQIAHFARADAERSAG